MFKKVFNQLFRIDGSGRLFDLLERLDRSAPGRLRVLTYHRVEDGRAFRKQMDFLANTYRVISISDLLDACYQNKPLPPRALLITFDDAYRNFAETAWPILKQYGFPAALFIPTAYPDQPENVFWWDQLEYAFSHTLRRGRLHTPAGALQMDTSKQRTRAFKRLRRYVKTLPNEQVLDFVEKLSTELETPRPPNQVLSWEELRGLANEGVVLGAHTRSHPLLNRVPLQEAQAEISGSLRDLQRELDGGSSNNLVFAYPGGAFTPEVARAVRETGFRLAFTIQRGTNDVSHFDPLLIRRNNIGRRASQPVLRARLLQASPYLDRFQPILGE